MKLFVFVCVALSTACCDDFNDDVPTFSPAECTGKDAFFAMCMNVDFADGSNDIMLLKQNSDEPTIFEGRLKNERAKVVLIHPDDDDTLTIGVRSQHVKKCSLFIVDAATYEAGCVGGLQLNNTDPDDRMLTPYTAPKPERSLAERNLSPRSLDPKGYRINVAIIYDDFFNAEFGTKSETKMREIMAVVNNMYSEKNTLTTELDIHIMGIKHSKESKWGGSFGGYLNGECKKLAENSEHEANLYIFVTGTNPAQRLLGRAFGIGTVCDSGRGSRTNMNKYAGGSVKGAVAYTAETIAHEMGHNLGMWHDFDDSKGPGNYKELDGKLCKGYMDYNDNTNLWSHCSAKYFGDYLDKVKNVCLLSLSNCGGNIRAPGTEFMSTNHPQEYDNDQDCARVIKFGVGQTIALEFSAFSVEHHPACAYDWLEVRDGGSESSKLIGSKMCGSALPQTIESSGNELFVKFHSDYSVVKTGYKIKAKLGAKGDQGCGGVITTSGAVFASTNYPNSYDNNEDCSRVIKFGNNQKVSLEFEAFDLEQNKKCKYDWLEVRDGDSSSANLIGSKMCGSTVPATIVSTGNALFVRFKSDHSVVKKGYKIIVTAA